MYEGRLELVDMVLNAVADRAKLLSQKDIYGNSAVHLAVMSNSPDVLRLLLDCGANKELPNDVIRIQLRDCSWTRRR